MNIILFLAPFSVFLGLLAVAAFVWTLRSGQYEDIEGSAARILIDDPDPDLLEDAALRAPVAESAVTAGQDRARP